MGRAGEKKASEFLAQKGYKILSTNFKTHIGEIDIIAKDGESIVFVEVKTRSSEAFGTPGESVDIKKQEKYVKIAMEYLIRNNYQDKECRFDVVEIVNGQINHIIDAFIC